MQKGGAEGGAPPPAAPTGCFKCGRPGHWSRDCPFSPATSTDPSANPNPKPPAFSSSKFPQHALSGKEASAAPAKAAKKAPKTRPKLTPDLLLSDDGLGYVLRHFPRNFKHRGKDKEVADLGNLIGMYAEWHSRLIPYYSFYQFVHKVEQVGATKRVRRCISELRERVARGGDPAKLHEPPVEQTAPDCDQDGTDMGVPVDMEEPATDKVDQPQAAHDGVQEDMFDEIYWKATEESGPSQQEQGQASKVIAPSEVHTEERTLEETPKQPANNTIATSKPPLTEEQRARIEANRLKALQRAAARASSSKSPS